MKANIRKVRKHRKFTVDFKRSIVHEYEKGGLSVTQLGKLYNLAPQSIYNWIYKFSKFNEKGYRIVENKESVSSKLKQLEEKCTNYEALLGRKQIEIDFLEKIVELANREYGTDLKKTLSTQQSKSSKNQEL